MLQELSLDQIKAKAPQAFATAQAENTSGKYSFLPTTRIIEDMSKLGWLVTDARSMKSSGKNALRGTHGRHQIEFFHPDITIKSGDDTEAFVKILIENNSMGVGRLKVDVGVFRLICSNGLIIKDVDFGSFKLRHLGYTFEDLQEMTGQIVNRLPIAVGKINAFSSTIMTPEQMKAFAGAAIKARMGEEKVATDLEIEQVLSARRPQDQGDSLWLVLNRVQESLVRGGSQFVDNKGKLRTLRPIKNMLSDMKLNGDIWELANQYATVA